MLNNEKLLFALNDAPDELLERARESLGYAVTDKRSRRPRRLWRTLLIAAVIASLMAGSAYAAGWIRLDSLRAGSAYGVQVISREGLMDSPEGKALAEWLAYYGEHQNDTFDPAEAFDLSEEYGVYGVTSRDMADEVDEICAKYGLEKLGRAVYPQDERSFWKTAGVGKLTRGSDRYENDYQSGYVYPGGTFQYDGLLFPAEENYTIAYQLRRSAKGSFGYVVSNSAFLEGGEEWLYRTQSGTELTLINAPQSAMMLLDTRDAFISVGLSKAGIRDEFNDGVIDGVGDSFVTFEISNEQLEQIAESFDWKALTDPDAGMDGVFAYHQYAPRRSSGDIAPVDADLSMVREAFELAVRVAYRDTIAPYIRDFELVDYGAAHLSRGVGGWMLFRGTPKKAIDWKRIPTEGGELFCRSFQIINDNGTLTAGESFDALPYRPLEQFEFVTVNGEEKENWLGTDLAEITAATLYVQQTGLDYTLSDPQDLSELNSMLRFSEITGGTDCQTWNPLYLTFADGRHALAFTAADGSDSVGIFGALQRYQYGRTIFDLFGVPLEAAGYTRHDGVLTYREDDDRPGALRSWEETDYTVGGQLIARRVMSDMLRESRYEYDDRGHLTRQSWWEGDTMTVEVLYTYDNAGRLIRKEENFGRGWAKTSYEYDAQGRLTAELHSDSDDLPGAIGGNIYYSYDEDGICTRTMGWQMN